MKKALLIIALAGTVTFGAQAQIQPDNPPAVVYGGFNDNLIEAHFDVLNSGSTDIDVHCYREEMNLVTGSQNSFCWGPNCYPPFVDQSTEVATIVGNGTDGTFKGDYKPQGNSGISTIKYCWFVEGDSANTLTCTTIDFDATFAQSVGENAYNNQVSAAYPNPAKTIVSMNYNVHSDNAQIVLHNMLGAKVEEYQLGGLQGVAVMNVEELENGVYFYSLVVDEKVISTQKLVVSH